jgi:hypothetical protein
MVTTITTKTLVTNEKYIIDSDTLLKNCVIEFDRVD